MHNSKVKSKNRERLENNQADSLQLAEDVLSGSATGDTIVTAQIPNHLSVARFTTQGITDLIRQFDVKYDQDRNITRYSRKNSDGSLSVVRDARNYSQPSKEVEDRDPNSMYMQMAASTRAALYMLEQHKNTIGEEAYNKAHDRLYVLFNNELEHYNQKKQGDLLKRLKDYNKLLLDVVVDHTIAPQDSKKEKHLKADLAITMHVMNMQAEDYHINTINKFRNHNIIESDVLMLGVTEEQQKQLIALKNNDQRALSGIPWYNALSPYRQGLARFAASQMLDDNNKVVKKVPTQLRTLVPFGRNMYAKFTYVQDKDEQPKLVAEMAHTGAVYYAVKNKDADKQVAEMARQIQSFAPYESSKINQISTISPNNPFNRNEAKVNIQTKKAMAASDNFTVTSPLNLFRKLGGRDYSGYYATLAKLADINTEVLQVGDYNPITEYLKTGRRKNIAIDYLKVEFEKTLDPDRKAYLESMYIAVQARELLDTRPSLFEKFGNNNLKLIEYFSQLQTATREGGSIQKYADKVEADVAIDLPYCVVNCMSGKDRTGIAMFVATVVGIARNLGALFGLGKAHDDTDTLSALASRINHAGHTQQIPSQNDAGTHGVSPNSRLAEGFSYLENDTLTRASAKTNKFSINENVKVDIKALDRQVEVAKTIYNSRAEEEEKAIAENQQKLRTELSHKHERLNKLEASNKSHTAISHAEGVLKSRAHGQQIEQGA